MKNAYIKYISSLLLFGSNGIVASYILLGSVEIVFTRTLIGGIFLLALFLLSKGRLYGKRSRKDILYIAVSGAAMGLSWMLLYEGYSRVGVSVATLLYYCGPVIIAALSPFLFGERLTAAKLAGFASVLAGMVLVNGGSLSKGGSAFGIFCCILAAFMYVVMIISNKKASGISGLENSVWQLSVSFFVVLIFVLARGGISFASVSAYILPILLLGVVNTGVGCYLYFSAIGHLPAQSVAIIGYLEPLSALVFSAVLLRERLTLPQVIGAALILGGAAAGELFHGKSAKRRLE